MVEYEILPEDFLLRFFPRNLSYSEESYLDNFSTCSSYVKSPKSREVVKYVHSRIRQECEICDSDIGLEFDVDVDYKVKVMDADEGTDVDFVKCDTVTHGKLIQIGSEEGVFLNMMDDLESVESPCRQDSDCSDPSYFSLESANSPDDGEELILPSTQTELTNAVSKELQKTELRKHASDSNIEAKNDAKITGGEVSKTELKKTNSADNVLKLASLKIEIKGESIEAGAHKYLLHVPDSPLYAEPEFNFNRAELRKSSSLKTTKTPPGTPARKKMVRFADVMGLDLESIRHVLDADNPPRIPASAIKDLKVGVEQERREVGSRYLDLCFQQPCALENFMTNVMSNKISLENCVVTDMSITGIVRVANIGYHKCVRVRYSVNNWVTFYDVMASYVLNSCDGVTDRFSFTIVSPSTLGPGSKISFAVSFTVNDHVYWDSNSGKNYDILCYAKTTPTDLEASWLHFV